MFKLFFLLLLFLSVVFGAIQNSLKVDSLYCSATEIPCNPDEHEQCNKYCTQRGCYNDVCIGGVCYCK